MANPLVTTRSSVTVYNLVNAKVDGTADATEVDILNSGPTPVNSADEIDGMFLRSRIDWTNDVTSSRPTINANAGSGSKGIANIFQVIEVPNGTVVHELMLAGPDASNQPTHSHTGAVGASASLYFGAAVYTNASKSTLKFDLDGLGRLAVASSGGAIATFPTFSASTPETRVKAVSLSSVGTPIYFPHGGYIEMQMTGGASTASVTGDGSFAGVLELIVRASKLPE